MMGKESNISALLASAHQMMIPFLDDVSPSLVSRIQKTNVSLLK